ncbi:fructokinase [Alkalithermobacter thermoalcaliphilus JW-YL-7 = DSM 7308]|uniref:Fructokinase n=1 Tax=Alkalithermobacter thermoalcaliphilus JW-YL-7 = DSM 7308 TaxID=1121328 RepID=A0A150FRZ8_CLOPD|nr:Fructokinase [[Clostridium] paradoxum JW-YL-7 = DSM 7308]SHK34639.1 fructokinase [[Clostridium] paradoxum JW-YL-7 = DSM 7308]
MKGIVCLGEALIDFIPADKTNTLYEKCPGGAPANVSVGLARLSSKSIFVGKLGDDILGRFLENTLKEKGVNTEYIKYTNDARTGVVFVELDESGERSFSFYINPSADRFLSEEDIDENLFKENKILHIGSISMISGPSKSATKKAVNLAKSNNMLISYDPNLRLGLWDNEQNAKDTIISMLSYTDILKISDEELKFITGESDIKKGLDAMDIYNIPLIFVTMGKEGSYFKFKGQIEKVESMKVETVDTTGAGDAFVSGVLHMIDKQEKNILDLSKEEVVNITKFASVCGALAASAKGAMTSLPTIDKVNDIMKR